MRTLLTLATILYLFSAGSAAASQQSAQTPPTQAPQPPEYPDSAAGLRHLLADMLGAAKSSDPSHLDALIAATEIPNSTAWFITTFGETDGGRRAAEYERTLAQREAEFRRRLLNLAQRDGQFSVIELVPTDLYTTLQTSLDAFAASWQPPESSGLPRRPIPVATFFFVAGKFRLD